MLFRSRVSNLFGTITAIILTLPSGLEGAKVTRIRTLARYLDAVNFTAGNPTADPTAEFPREIYYVDRKSAENRDVVEFELAAVFDLAGVRAPKRQCIANICQWIYKGPQCGYTGTAYFNTNDEIVATSNLDQCGKRLNSCELRFGQLRRTGSVTSGSTTLVLTEITALNTGDSVTGFGIPADTTVVSYTNNNVTISKSATASTTITKTGTVDIITSYIVLSDTTNLSVGMSVTGSYLNPNTQIVSIDGNTVELSSPVDITPILTPTTTFTSVVDTVYVDDGIRNWIYAPSSTSIFIGQYISGSYIPLSTQTYVTDIGRYKSYLIIYISTEASIDLTQVSETYTLYNISSFASSTYTFTATSQAYTFRTDAFLPFGSFPGIGAYNA